MMKIKIPVLSSAIIAAEQRPNNNFLLIKLYPGGAVITISIARNILPTILSDTGLTTMGFDRGISRRAITREVVNALVLINIDRVTVWCFHGAIGVAPDIDKIINIFTMPGL